MTPTLGPVPLANAACAAALVAAWVATLPAGAKRHVVLSPGARSTPLVLALAKEPRVCAHVVLDERDAGFVALGLAQAGGRAVVVVTTSGSAAAHALPAAMEAHHAGLPLLLVTADRPPEGHQVGASQTTPQQDLYRAHARQIWQLPCPVPYVGAEQDGPAQAVAATVLAAWQGAAVRALAAAEGTLPGPVHLNAPFREPLGTQALPPAAAAALFLRPSPTYLPAVAAASPGALAALLDFLAPTDAQGPLPPGLIVCGAQLPAAPAGTALAAVVAQLAQRLGWPVVADGVSNVRRAAGAEAGWVGSSAAAILRADLPGPGRVLLVGAAPLSRAAQALVARAQRRCLVAAPGTFADAAHGSHLVLEADAVALLGRCLAALPAPARAGGAILPAQQQFGHAWRAAQRAFASACAASARAPRAAHLCEGLVLQQTLAALPARCDLLVGNSLAVRDLDDFLGPLPTDAQVWHRRGVSGIDGALAHLLGIGLASGRPTVAVLGDLTLLHGASALRLCAQAELPLTVVVCSNQGGQIFAQLPIAHNAEALERFFLTPQAQALAPLCAAHGVHHQSAANLEALQAALTQALRPARAGGLWLIEVPLAPAKAQQGRAAWQAHVAARVAQTRRI